MVTQRGKCPVEKSRVVIRKDLAEKVLFEQRLGGVDGASPEGIWGAGAVLPV